MTPTRKEDQQKMEGLTQYETGGLVPPRKPESPDSRGDQRKLIEDLARLQDSLRGPEVLLDKTNYSRPFPPPPSYQDGKYLDAERQQEEPFGRSS